MARLRFRRVVVSTAVAVVPLVAWLRVRWFGVASPNVIASRSGGLASVAFCMYSLCARRDVARVFVDFELWMFVSG